VTHDASDAGADGESAKVAPPPIVAQPQMLVSRAPVTRLALGHSHSCAVHEDGSASCWGANWGGQLGDGTLQASATPVRVTVADDIVEMAARYGSTCARRRSGKVICWGDEGIHEGPRDRTVRRIENVEGAVQIVNDCARDGHDQVRCWTPVDGAPAAPSLEARHIATHMGDAFRIRGCAVTPASTVVCWEGVEGKPDVTPVPVAGVSNAVEVAVGFDFACARSRDMTVTCWGVNALGQLGRGFTTVQHGMPMRHPPPLAAARVSSLTNIVEIAAAHMGACARDASGAVFCWGSAVDVSTTPPQEIPEPAPAPRRIRGLGPATHIALGAGHACVITAAGVSCWGKNKEGQVGMGWRAVRARPLLVPGIEDAVLVEADFRVTCASTRSRALTCWGQPDPHKPATATPAAIPGFEGIVQLTESCARDEKGRVRCMGIAGDGAPGKGPLPAVIDVSTNTTHGCAVTPSGAVWCWGRNDYGQQGRGFISKADVFIPPSANGITDAVRVAAGAFHTCVVKRTGELACFGAPLGAALQGGQASPITVVGLSDVTMAAGGAGFFCALTNNGDVGCWGDNAHGELGDGTTTSRASPAKVAKIGGAKKIAAGISHACALVSSGKIACWGRNNYGQLGDGTEGTTRTEPVFALGVSDAVDVSTSGGHTCAVLKSGRVTCWGEADRGQVGTVVAEEIMTPTVVDFARHDDSGHQ
jgi:alpha-tubulin suppressor-like RCC1 family protein